MMSGIEIKIENTVGECTEFVPDKGKKKESVSIIVSPLKVSVNENEDRISVTNGCNMWKSCQQEACWYSVAARDRGRDQR